VRAGRPVDSTCDTNRPGAGSSTQADEPAPFSIRTATDYQLRRRQFDYFA